MSAPFWSPAAIVTGSYSNIVIDGGVNGLIIATANGTGLAYTNTSKGVSMGDLAGYITVKNLTISNLYVRTPGCNEYSPEGLSQTSAGTTVGVEIRGSHINVISNTIDGAEAGVSIKSWGGGFTNSDINVFANSIYNVCMSGNIAGDGGTPNSHLYNVAIVSNRCDHWSTWSAALPGTGTIHLNGFFMFLTAGHSINTNNLTVRMPTYYPANYPTTFTTNGVTIAYSNIVGTYVAAGYNSWAKGSYVITNDTVAGIFRLIANGTVLLNATPPESIYETYLSGVGFWSYADQYLTTSPYTNGWPIIGYQKIDNTTTCIISNVVVSHNYFGPDVLANTVVTNVDIAITNVPTDGQSLIVTFDGVTKTFVFKTTPSVATDVKIVVGVDNAATKMLTAQQLALVMRTNYSYLVEWKQNNNPSLRNIVNMSSRANGTLTWSGSSCLKFMPTPGVAGDYSLRPNNTSAVLQQSTYGDDITFPNVYDVKVFNNVFVWTNKSRWQTTWNNGYCQYAGRGNSIVANNTLISQVVNRDGIVSGQGAAFAIGHNPAHIFNNFTLDFTTQTTFDPNTGLTNYNSGTQIDYNCWGRPNTLWLSTLLNQYDFYTPPIAPFGNFNPTYWVNWKKNVLYGFSTPFDQHSKTNCPLINAVTYQPLASDTVLVNAGTNLTSWGIVNDFYGNPRPATGPWTIGAFQTTSAQKTVLPPTITTATEFHPVNP